MAFFDKVQDFVKSASDKTSEAIEVSKMKATIAGEKRAVNEQMAKLGEIYYAQYKDNGGLTPEAVNICMTIDKHNAKIEECQAEIQRINDANAEKRAAKNAGNVHGDGEVECPECHSANPEGTKFCGNCGAKIPEIVEAEAVEVEQEAASKRYCSNCGAEIGKDKNFCSECGTKAE